MSSLFDGTIVVRDPLGAVDPAAGTPPPEEASDEALLQVLAGSPRMSYEGLARALGVSRATVRARLLRLRAAGTMVVGVVHPSVFGLDVCAHVLVDCGGSLRPLAERIGELAEVSLVSIVSGRRPLVVEVRTGDQARLSTVLARIAAIQGVRSTESALYLDLVLGPDAVVRPAPVPALDEVDRRLLVQLQMDGRRSFAALGGHVGLSTGAARARVLRLLGCGVVQVRVRMPPEGGRVSQTGMGIRLEGDRPATVGALAELRQVRYLATTLGRWDAIGTVHAGPGEEEDVLLDEVRSVPGVAEVETWRHLRFVKESYAVGGETSRLGTLGRVDTVGQVRG